MADFSECMSKELKEWLDKRNNALKLKQAIREMGGHVMLRSSAIDPDELPEPLRSEATHYLKTINLGDTTHN
jgi:hypothetical protein